MGSNSNADISSSVAAEGYKDDDHQVNSSYDAEIRRLTFLSELILRRALLTKRLALKMWKAVIGASRAAAVSASVEVEVASGKRSVVQFRSFTRLKKVEIFNC